MNSKNENKPNTNTANGTCPKCGATTGTAAFCPDCGAKTRSVSTDEKRARLAEKSATSGRTGLFASVAAIAALAIGVAILMLNRPAGPERATAAHTTQTAAGMAVGADRVEIALADLQDGKARHYTWKAPDGKQIRFFAIKSEDGVVRTAFDACDVCWPERKGYSQDGKYMVCNNCGQRFESSRVNEIKGGCNPSPLERRVEGDRLVIMAADLQAGARYF